MPPREKRVMEPRLELVPLAVREGANVRELCCRYGISPTTGYRYLERWRAEGSSGQAASRYQATSSW